MLKRTIRARLTDLENRGTRFDLEALKKNLCPFRRAGITEEQRLAKQGHLLDSLLKHALGDRLMTRWSQMENGRWTSRPNVLGSVNNHRKVFLPDPGMHLVDALLLRCEVDFALQMAGLDKLAALPDLHQEMAICTDLDRQTAKLHLYKLLYGMKREPETQLVADAVPKLVDFIDMVNSSNVILSPAGTPVRMPVGKNGTLFNRYLQVSASEIATRWVEEINQDLAMLLPDGALFQVPDGQTTQYGTALIAALKGLDLPDHFSLTVDLTDGATGNSYRARFTRH